MKNSLFYSALANMAKLSKNSKLPILDNILFSDGKMIATDLESFMIYDSDFSGNFLADSKTLQKISQKVDKNADVQLYKSGEKIKLAINGSEKFTFSCDCETEDFPLLPAESFNEIIFTESDYKNAVRASAYVATDELRPALMSVHIGADIVASDAHKMFFIKKEIPQSDAILIPGVVFKYLPKEGIKSFSNSQKYVQLTFDGFSFITRKIEEEYPNYKAVIPEEFNGELSMSHKELKSHVEMALLAAGERQLIKFRLADKCYIYSDDLDYGREYKSEIVAKYTGKPMDIGFKGSFLLDVLKDMTEITGRFVDPSRAAVFNGEMLLLPMMIIN